MKRQSMGLRRASGDSEQSPVKENKRRKVQHQQENFSFNIDADTGSESNSEEYNFNGHHNILKSSMTAEENSFQTFSENGELHNSQMNGSIKNISENPENNNFPMNGSEDHDRIHMQSDNSEHANGFGSDSDENNSQNLCIESNNLSNNITDNDSSEVSSNQENPSSESNDIIESSKLNNTDFPTTSMQSDICTEQMQLAMNLNDFNKNEKSDTSNISKTLPEEISTGNLQTEATGHGSSSLPDKQASSSSLEDNSSMNMISRTSQVGKFHVDVENITMCQLTVTELDGHADVVFSVAADEDFILSSSGDTTVKVWNVEEKKEICNFAGHHAAVSAVVLLGTEQSEMLRSKLNCPQTPRIAVSASYDCHIRLWSVFDGLEILSMYTFNSITCMGYLEDFMYVVIGTEGGKLEIWDLHLAKIVHSVYAHDSSVSNLEVHECYVYSASKDGAVKVWLFDEDELQPLYTRRRKDFNSNTADFGPTQWKAITVYNDMLFLGDNTSCLKALDWRIGRLRLYMNQPDSNGICEAVLAKYNILLTTFYDSNSDTGGINVWRLPDVAYVGTMTGDLQEICSLAITQSENRLRIVSGGHQLLVWDYDFSKPPVKSLQDPFFVCEVEKVGSEVDEKSVETMAHQKYSEAESTANAENKKSWCSIS